MSITIPPEARALVDQFKAEQAAEAAKRRPVQEERVDRREQQRTRRQWTTQQICAYAIEAGLRVGEGGRHSLRIVAPDGRDFRPVPNHKGNLSTGTAIALVKWIDRLKDQILTSIQQ